ncbi:MAG: hypothetical protein MJZ20_02540 [Bacteroidaceae bacterium]|nr:hypothetical protein [Bacteroidaceae bacterium]
MTPFFVYTICPYDWKSGHTENIDLKQTYYQHDENAALAKADMEEFALQYTIEIRQANPIIGGMKMWHMYRKVFGLGNARNLCPNKKSA